MTKSIMLVGVGGQGTILAGSLLSKGLLRAGYHVKVSEIVGMSQRGGSVSTHIRYGESVQSPVIELGGCDFLIAFEQMEAVRYLPYLKPEGKIVVNMLSIPPTSVTIGQAEYPKHIIEYLNSEFSTTWLDAQNIAQQCGNGKTMNVVLLGAAISLLCLETVDWEEIIKENVKPQFVQPNLAALKSGMQILDKR